MSAAGAPEPRGPIAAWIALCARQRGLTILLVAAAALWGLHALRETPLDALPDLSDVQVIVFSEWPGRSPDLVEAQVYEAEIPLVGVGTPAEVVLPSLPGRRFEGRVAWVQPDVSGRTRAARVRVELANRDGALRPDMLATVLLRPPGEPRLMVPLSAVLHAGARSFVFLDLGEGRLRPQPVEVGLRSGEEVEIRSGLAEGQAVVASATFLVAAESRLRAALEQW